MRTTHSNEEQDTPTQATDQVDTNPGKDFKQIVGTGHQAESETRWDTALGSTRSAQVAQHQVGVQIGQLAKCEESQSCVKKLRVEVVSCRGRVGAEDPVCDVEASQDPVVCTVLEDIAGRHRRIAEAVNEDGFELAFQEMDAQKGANQKLDVGGIGERLVEVVVDERPQREEEEGRNDERTKVFNNEHGPPSDLGACKATRRKQR